MEDLAKASGEAADFNQVKTSGLTFSSQPRQRIGDRCSKSRGNRLEAGFGPSVLTDLLPPRVRLQKVGLTDKIGYFQCLCVLRSYVGCVKLWWWSDTGSVWMFCISSVLVLETFVLLPIRTTLFLMKYFNSCELNVLS